VLECDYRRGFGLDIGFIDHFNTQLVITFNYSAIDNFDILQFARVHARSFPARSVFTSSCLVTSPNNGYSSASRLKFLSEYRLPSNWTILASIVLLITPLHGPIENTVSNTFIVACVSVAAGTRLPSCCLETALHATILIIHTKWTFFT
jgi:hypothetical protein